MEYSTDGWRCLESTRLPLLAEIEEFEVDLVIRRNPLLPLLLLLFDENNEPSDAILTKRANRDDLLPFGLLPLEEVNEELEVERLSNVARGADMSATEMEQSK